MTITFYINLSDNRTMSKNLSPSFSASGTLRNACEITDPVIIVEASNLSEVNYMYIQEFGRYYFLTRVTSIKNNLWEVTGHCDVLMSFKDGIINNEAIIEKQENIYNDDGRKTGDSYIDDGSFVTEVKRFTEIITFPSGLGEGKYVLAAVGGVQNANS